jgi:two-component system sensor histidine kinase ChiS
LRIVTNYVKHLLLINIFLLNLSSFLYGSYPNIKVEHLSPEDGVSFNLVYCIFQDSKGFMWFGTLFGLYKFDGNQFITYRYDPGDPYSISDDVVVSIYEDNEGYLWIGTESGGLNRFDPTTERFKHYMHRPEDHKTISSNTIWATYQDRSGTIWVATTNGLDKMIREADVSKSSADSDLEDDSVKFVHYQHDPSDPSSLSKNIVSTILEDRFGKLWVGTFGGGINVLDKEKEQFIHFKHDPKDRNSLSSDVVNSIFEDSEGQLWIATFGGGLNRYNHQDKVFIRYRHDPSKPNSLGSNNVNLITEDRSGRLWIATAGGGVNVFDKHEGKFTSYRHDPLDDTSIGDDRVMAMCMDKSGILWLSPSLKGIDKLLIGRNKFQLYRRHPLKENSLSDNHINALYSDEEGDLWIGTVAVGLNRLEVEKNLFTHFRADSSRSNWLTDNYIAAITGDSHGNIWIGVLKGGLNVYNKKTNQFVIYKHDPDNPHSLGSDFVTALYRDAAGDVWIGTQGGGLNKFDAENKRFIRYPAETLHIDNWSSVIVSINESRSGNLWIGTNEGLVKFNPDRGQSKLYQHDPQDMHSLSNNTVYSTLETQNGTLWVGTARGLNKFNPELEEFMNFTENDGLPNSVIKGILEDANGNLWISTNYGLSRFNPEKNEFRNYTVEDGLQSNLFNNPAYAKSTTGEMFFGGIYGLNRFHPDSVKDNPYKPPVVITNFKVFDSPLSPRGEFPIPKTISELKEIHLSYVHNFFTIRFAALDYANPKKNQYSYKLEGVDKDWIDNGTDNEASYTNIDPGTYTFKVKGANNDGVRSEKAASLRIIIAPPFWRTWWFYTLIGVIAVGLFIFIYHSRTDALRKEKQLQEEFSKQLIQSQEKERRRIAAELHDSLSQNLIVINNTIQQVESPDGSQQQMQQISSMVMESLDEVREIAYNLHPHQLDRLGLKKAVESVINKVAHATDIQFSLNIDDIDNIFPKDLEITFYRIVQEAINNIVKHSEAQKASVRIQKNKKNVHIKIRDNGKGFNVKGDHSTNSHQGFGLMGIMERVRLINGTMQIHSQPRNGTTITIQIPLNLTI